MQLTQRDNELWAKKLSLLAWIYFIWKQRISSKWKIYRYPIVIYKDLLCWDMMIYKIWNFTYIRHIKSK